MIEDQSYRASTVEETNSLFDWGYCTHDDLRACEPRTATVVAVARRWGFAHLGRFAREYRFRFGVSASETLATPPGRPGE